MKTLVNKHNPAIRITAPEIVLCVNKEEYWIVGIPQTARTYLAKDWTLVEEESVEWSDEDENNTGWLIAYLEGKSVYHSDELHKSVIKWLRGIRDRLKSLRPQPKEWSVEEEPEGWNKADCVKEIPFSLIYEEFSEHWRLGKAVEPGDYYIPISRLRWGGNLEEIPSNVNLEKAAEEYADKHGFRVPYDGSNNFYDDVDVKASLEGFKAGAKWMAEQIKGGSK